MANDFRVCAHCKKLFRYMGDPLCPVCLNEMDESFDKVKNYIYDNPNASMAEIAEETEVSMDMITRMLKDGRLELSNAHTGNLVCERCGKPIVSGKLCVDCRDVVREGVETARKEIQVSMAEELRRAGIAQQSKMQAVNRRSGK